MNNSIHPCLWFDGNAKEAATFYCSIFDKSNITVDTPMVVNFNLSGQKFMGLNGGQIFTFNPSVSMFIFCKTEDNVESVWNALSTNGNLYMPLGEYPWSKKYGWCAHKFSVSWQVVPKVLGKLMTDPEKAPRVVQAFMKMNKLRLMNYFIQLLSQPKSFYHQYSYHTS